MKTTRTTQQVAGALFLGTLLHARFQKTETLEDSSVEAVANDSPPVVDLPCSPWSEVEASHAREFLPLCARVQRDVKAVDLLRILVWEGALHKIGPRRCWSSQADRPQSGHGEAHPRLAVCLKVKLIDAPRACPHTCCALTLQFAVTKREDDDVHALRAGACGLARRSLARVHVAGPWHP